MRINKELSIITRITFLLVLLFVFFQLSCSSSKVGTMYYQENSDRVNDFQEFYAAQGIVTDPGKHIHLYKALPRGVTELCQVVQGLMIHIYQAHLYGLKISEQRTKEVSIRKVEDMLERIIELDDSSLDQARDPKSRLVGNCRDFSVLTCSFFRHNGIPARVRPGFGTYFSPGFYEDHWICEYWNQAMKRWVQVDAQLDIVQKKYHKLNFNSMDLPKGKFLYGPVKT